MESFIEKKTVGSPEKGRQVAQEGLSIFNMIREITLPFSKRNELP